MPPVPAPAPAPEVVAAPVQTAGAVEEPAPAHRPLSFAQDATEAADNREWADNRDWDRPGGDFEKLQGEDESYPSEEEEADFRPSRNPLRMWTAAAVAFALVVSALAGSVWWFGLPDWLPGGGPAFRKGVPGLELSFPATRQDRRTLPNGAEYFGATGTITNTGKEPVNVPPLLIVLLDSQNRVIDHREIAPPKRTLQPGESVTVNEALTDVSREVVGADIGWKAE